VLIAVTGYGRESDQERSNQTGFDYHLVKPADPAKLQALLAKEIP
jgi:CheY-like chemotaxis protein